MRDAKGSALRSVEEPKLFRTCMFSTYMTDYIPAVMREVNSLYDIDAIYTNGWPPLGSLPECHCQECSKLPPSGTPAYWEHFNKRFLYLWNLYDGIAKEKKPTSFYFANLGAGAHAAPNLAQVGKICAWFHADNQGRTEAAPIWECSLQGRVCNAVQDGKIAVNCTGAYATGSLRWRNAAKSPAELTMWFNETLASGMVLDNHFVGAEKGLGEDRRIPKVARTDLSLLLQNTIRWVAGDNAPYSVTGDGLVETFGWETESGYAVHVLNYNNPNAHRGSMRKSYPIGEQKVKMQLPSGAKVTRVQLLRAERDIPFHVAGQTIEFTIPRVDDYEVAALHTS